MFEIFWPDGILNTGLTKNSMTYKNAALGDFNKAVSRDQTLLKVYNFINMNTNGTQSSILMLSEYA